MVGFASDLSTSNTSHQLRKGRIRIHRNANTPVSISSPRSSTHLTEEEVRRLPNPEALSIIAALGRTPTRLYGAANAYKLS